MRTRIGMTGIIAAIVLLLAATPTRAQEEPRILYSGPFGWDSNPITGALSSLGVRDDTTTVFQSEDLLLPALRDGPWDLIIIRWFDAFEGPLASDIIDELAAYVDGGGKLMFSMAELDEQPELWPVLGIESSVDVVEPLQDIVSPAGIGDPDMWHPAFLGILRVNQEPLPPTSDYGDRLEPGIGGFAVSRYIDDRTAAIVLSRSGQVITHGPHWDYWESGVFVAEWQIQWLLGCPADLDGDGDLTIFDFFEFQSRFDAGGDGGFADFDYNGRLDIFDFLEYVNLFDAGC